MELYDSPGGKAPPLISYFLTGPNCHLRSQIDRPKRRARRRENRHAADRPRTRAYAARKGWTVDDRYIYVDDGISGAEFANRPGILRLR